eukprot:SAG25_NODE_5656_length_634_cov_0.927103_1_plen_115_part_10
MGYNCEVYSPCLYYERACPRNARCTSLGPGMIDCACALGFERSRDGCRAVDACAAIASVNESCIAKDEFRCAQADISMKAVQASNASCRNAGVCKYIGYAEPSAHSCLAVEGTRG